MLGTLREAGWTGMWDLEIFGVPDDPESFWALDVDEAARRAYASTGSLPN
jgi:hypothetical protein